MQQVETTEQISDEEYNEILEKIEADNKAKSEAEAAKILRKHKREITRLIKLAEVAVCENNYPSYEYAIMKLRDIYRQPYTKEIIQTGWVTTRQTVLELINAGAETV